MTGVQTCALPIYDFDSDSIQFDDDFNSNDEEGFGDVLLTLGLTVALGGVEEEVVVVETEEVPVADCSTLDDDRDGVNNCDDKCPDSTAGQVVGPDGCPVPDPAPAEVMEPQEYKG